MRTLCLFVLILSHFLLQSCAAVSPSGSVRYSGKAIAGLQGAIEEIFSDPIMARTQYGAKIQSMQTGKILYEHNSRTLFHPASNMKLLTTAVALSRLGVNYRFKTILALDSAGVITSDSVLQGNLYVKGGGDPELEPTDLLEMVDYLKSKPIRRIAGDLIADDSFLDTVKFGQGWMWDDNPATYIPHLSALSLARNVTRLIVTPGHQIGDTLHYRFVPYSPEFGVQNTGVTCDTLVEYELTVDRDWTNQRNDFVISGSYPLGTGPKTTWLNVENPTLFTVSVLYDLIKKAGIEIEGKYFRMAMPDSVDTLLIHRSAPLSQVVYNVNKVSDNLGAELILKTIGAELRGTPGSAQGGLSEIRSFLQEIGADSSTYRIVDGSGASHYDLVTADMLVEVLGHMYRNFKLQPEFVASLPIGGLDGTLRGRMKEGASFESLRAKTGTVSGVSTLSGYVATADGEIMAFSMMIQNFVGSPSPYRKLQDRIGDLLASFSRRE